jgi:hypothetical protein
MTHTSSVPFRPKPRTLDVDVRIRQAVDAVRAVEAHDNLRKNKVEQRSAAVTAALEAGATLQELAGVLGVTPGRVRQLSRGE